MVHHSILSIVPLEEYCVMSHVSQEVFEWCSSALWMCLKLLRFPAEPPINTSVYFKACLYCESPCYVGSFTPTRPEADYNVKHVASLSRMETQGDSWSWNKYNVVSLDIALQQNCVIVPQK